MATKRLRPRVLAREEVQQHNSSKSCWVTYQGGVYDVTSFVADHPGGDQYILDFAGQDVKAPMEDPDSHSHSDSAFDLLSDWQIGVVGGEETTCSADIEVDENYVPEETQAASDLSKNQFLDLSRPLIMQVWYGNFSKAFYLKQVHQPRYLPQPARLFGPSYLEILTKTSWYVVPAVWLPIAAYCFYKSLEQQAVVDAAGNFLWTIFEYTFHRFLFHLDDYLPDHPAALLVHFLLHGIHHYLPCDRLRLVMPPTLFAALAYPMTRLAYKLFPVHIANGIIAGAFVFYVIYDCFHYAMHHIKLPGPLKTQKIYHMAHHFKSYELGYGVTSRFWDWVFKHGAARRVRPLARILEPFAWITSSSITPLSF